MRIIKIGNEVYIEFTTTKSALVVAAKFAAVAIISSVSFYSVWILLEFLK